MIVYVESNFILEMVLGQKYASATDSILQLAESGKIELAFPSFALCEPFATITRRARDQERLSKSIEGMLDQLPSILRDLANKEASRLWSTISRLINVGTSIETSVASLQQALEDQTRLRLSPQDSIIYAAVFSNMQSRPFVEMKCFVNSNYKDFGNPVIISELNSCNCQYERNFGKGLSFIRSFI